MKSIIKSVLRYSWMLFLCITSFAQRPQPHGKLLDLIPPSPNAAALGKFGDVPVSHSTGIPKISIPVYNYSDNKGLALNISLDYHAGGIRVEEKSSNIGIGWALNFGSQISREIRQLPDEKSYWSNTETPDIPQIITTGANEDANGKFISYYTGLADTEADIFSFSFGNKSGKFVIGRNGQVLLFPQQNIKIEKSRYGNNLSFTLTDDDGSKYYFTEQENTWLRDQSGTLYEAGVSWFLSKIEAPFNTAAITFSYLNSISRYKANTGQVYYKKKPGLDYIGLLENIPVTGADYRDYDNKLISQIILPNGVHVDFIYDNAGRCDMFSETGPLKEVKISEGSNSKGIRLVQNYSFSDTTDFKSKPCNGLTEDKARLVLHKVIEYGDQKEKTPYIIDYNTGVDLPGCLSFAQDHWGFYNGANNNKNLVPFDGNVYAGTPPSSGGFDNADRATNPGFITAGTISKLTYPTGGYTQFTFEANDIPLGKLTGNYQPTYQYVKRSVALSNTDPAKNVKFKFSQTYATSDKTTLFKFYAGGLSGLPCTILPSIKKSDGSSSTDYGGIRLNSYYGWERTSGFYLPDGEYTFSYSFDGQACARDLYVVGMEWEERELYAPKADPTINMEYIGGLRIKKVETFDRANTPIETREFTYRQEGDTSSSGVLGFTPVYKYYYEESCSRNCEQGMNATYDVINSSSFYTLSNGLGSPVVYSRVVEKYTGSGAGNNGKTIRLFSTDAYKEAPIGFQFPFITPMQASWQQGSLLKETSYDSKDKIASEITNTYKDCVIDRWDGMEYFKCYKLQKTRRDYITMGSQNMLEETYRSSYYNFFTGRRELSKTIETIYDNNGNSLSSETNYEYDPVYFNLKKTKRTDSKKYTREERLYYPYDYTTGGAQQSLVTANMLSPVINKEIWEKAASEGEEKLGGGEIVEYKQFGTIIKPGKIYKFASNQPVSISVAGNFDPSRLIRNAALYITDLELNYDNAGNVIEQKNSAEIKQAFLYGYKNRYYPIAKIIGSDYNTALQKTDQNILTAPASDQALRTELNKLRDISGALVSTYTYQPLLGMTSETDPNGRTVYYEYDGLGRVEYIKDEEKKIIKKFCYNYNGQVDECAVSFTNEEKSQSFTKNNCATCTTPSTVIYKVLQGKYESPISQTDANQKAQNDINANGQNYANQNGVCNAISGGTNVSVSGNIMLKAVRPVNTVEMTNICTNQYYKFSSNSSTISGTVPIGIYTVVIKFDGYSITAPSVTLSVGTQSKTVSGTTGVSGTFTNVDLTRSSSLSISAF